MSLKTNASSCSKTPRARLHGAVFPTADAALELRRRFSRQSPARQWLPPFKAEQRGRPVAQAS